MSGERIVVAMSGGVDSSVAALLLRDRGFRVTGLHMRTGVQAGDGSRGCCGVEDSRDARRVAEILGIPFYSVNLEAEFGGLVDEFVREYRTGRTPNPCIRCNRDMKFGRLFHFAAAAGAECVATGHYASVGEVGGRFAIRRGVDAGKDQSYVLFPLSQEVLRRVVLPLGGLEKAAVRDLARAAGLPVAEKRESQEICFVPAAGYRALLSARGVGTPGVLVDEAGHEVGRHAGYEFFTVGQRRGIGAHGAARFVTGIDAATATVRIGPREHLLAGGLVADGWVGQARPVPEAGETFPARVKIRYRHPDAEGVVRGLGGGTVRVSFREPQSAVAPGQAVVAYEGDLVLGGGWIHEACR